MFPCSICGKIFTNNRNKLRHSKSHNVKVTFNCTECSKIFTRNHDLRRHMAISHCNDINRHATLDIKTHVHYDQDKASNQGN